MFSAGALATARTRTAEAAFNTSGLSPEEFKRAWIQRVRAERALGLTGQAEWRYAPTGEVEPFMAWYPGDEWVDHWALATSEPQAPMARSFAHEAAGRGKQLRTV